MSADAVALEVLRADRWKKDPLAVDTARFIESGVTDALARLQQAGKRPRWWRELLDEVACSDLWEESERTRRTFQALAVLLSADDLAAWMRKAKVSAFLTSAV